MRPLDPKMGLFPISVAAELIGVEPRILRFYEKRGIIKPSRSDGNRRLYSLEDLELLEYVHYMTHVRKVNLSGVKAILELFDQLPPETRKKEISSVEEKIMQLDNSSLEIFVRGSETVQRSLLDEGQPEEGHRQRGAESLEEVDPGEEDEG